MSRFLGRAIILRLIITAAFVAAACGVFFPTLLYPFWSYPSILDIFRGLLSVFVPRDTVEGFVRIGCFSGWGSLAAMQLFNPRLEWRRRIGRCIVLFLAGFPLAFGRGTEIKPLWTLLSVSFGWFPLVGGVLIAKGVVSLFCVFLMLAPILPESCLVRLRPIWTRV